MLLATYQLFYKTVRTTNNNEKKKHIKIYFNDEQKNICEDGGI